MIYLNIFLLILGFALLIKGADFFVDGCSAIATILKISPLIIGLTIVAFGTSAPELAVSLSASLKGEGGLSCGNVVGSNIFNLFMVLGFVAIFRPLSIDKSSLKKDFPFLILSSILLIALACDLFFNKSLATLLPPKTLGFLSRGDGIVLLGLFAIFLYYIIYGAISSKSTAAENSSETIKKLPLWKSLLFTVFGLAAIVVGGKLTVDSAIFIATFFKVSQTLIGLTICALGTSLPEFVTSLIAAKKGQNDIAVGNVLGSNIFNALLILGTASIVSPIAISTQLAIDLVVMLAATLLAFAFALSGKISRLCGILFTICYIAYMVFLLLR